jgi:cytochrome c peroxidase
VTAVAPLIVGNLLAVAYCSAFAESPQPSVTAILGLPNNASANATPAMVALGGALFVDKQLSRDGSISCASCHQAHQAFTDGRSVPQGVDGRAGTRNAPSLFNVGYAKILTWDGRRTTLETQVADPFTNPQEHGLANQEDLLARVVSRNEYRAQLRAAFPNQASVWRPQDLFDALAAYLRVLRAGDSPFDQYYYGKDHTALDASAIRGLNVFRGSAGCSQCHHVGPDHALFTDDEFHGGVGVHDIATRLHELTQKALSLTQEQISKRVTGDRELAALGRFLVTKNPQDIGKYKTPNLRNVALTAPYMHDGSIATLKDAIEYEIYYRGIELGRPLLVTPSERSDLLAFLLTLTSPCVALKACPGM